MYYRDHSQRGEKTKQPFWVNSQYKPENGKVTVIYGCFKDQFEYFKFEKKIPEENKNFYQASNLSLPIIEFYDLDYKLTGDVPQLSPEDIFLKLESARKKFHKNIDYKRYLSAPEYRIDNASNVEKTSIHVYVINSYFKNMTEQKIYQREFENSGEQRKKTKFQV